MRQLSRKFLEAVLYSLTAILLTLSTATFVHAQTFRGGINGTVTDKTGATVSNATVVAIQTETDIRHSTTSSSGGEFLFQDLPLGAYSVTVSSPGFQTVKTEMSRTWNERRTSEDYFLSFHHQMLLCLKLSQCMKKNRQFN